MHEHELKKNAVSKGQVLIITTSNNAMGDSGEQTGCWLGELAAPYYIFKDAGYDVTIASINGGDVPLDPNSMKEDQPASKRFKEDESAMLQLHNSVQLERITEPAAYTAIFLPGGHGVMWDLPNNPVLQQLLTKANQNGTIVSAVCHGPAGFIGATNASGEPLIKGRKISCFTDSEETAMGKDKAVPFLLESKLRELGAEVVTAANMSEHGIVDGNLITGQNPASAQKVGQMVLEAMQSGKFPAGRNIPHLLATGSGAVGDVPGFGHQQAAGQQAVH